MLRRTTLVLVLALVLVSVFHAPVSQGQTENSFAGTWYMTLDLGVPGLPPFVLGVRATESEGVEELGNPPQPGPFPNPNFGGGTLIFTCTGGVTGRATGLAWRHTPGAGTMPTGVSFTFELVSSRTPGTYLLRGAFVTPDRIEGRGVAVGDVSDPMGAGFDAEVGFDVAPVTFAMERAQSLCVDPTP